MKICVFKTKYFARIHSLLLTVFLAALLLFPLSSKAAGLVPCGGNGEPPCTLCHFVVGIQGLMKWGMGVAVIVGIAAFTFAGVLYIVSAGDKGKIDMAKSAMKNTVIGIVVMVGGWLVINYGMMLLGAKSGLVGSWYKFDSTCTISQGQSFTGSYGGATEEAGSGRIGLVGENCSDAETLKVRLAASGGSGKVCDSQCPTAEVNKVQADYKAYIDKYAERINLSGASLEQKKKLLAAIIFKESSGNPKAQNAHACGLMQTTYNNWANVSDCYIPDLNIQKGISILNAKLAAAPSSFGSTDISKLEMALATYNCCGNGINPNTRSNDCNLTTGWMNVPQWVCPINAGEMCGVRNYICGISACLK